MEGRGGGEAQGVADPKKQNNNLEVKSLDGITPRAMSTPPKADFFIIVASLISGTKC
jgi:hypothetical protein